jgi:hypothetical protein
MSIENEIDEDGYSCLVYPIMGIKFDAGTVVDTWEVINPIGAGTTEEFFISDSTGEASVTIRVAENEGAI